MLLAYSIRPLTLEELAEGMVIDHESRSFDPDQDRLANYRQVLEICSSLVSVTKTHTPRRYSDTPWIQEKNKIERGNIFHGGPAQELEVVQFAHFSVQEYMTLQRDKAQPRVSRFRFSPTTAHTAIAELSLVYVLEFSGGVRVTRIDFDGFPFLAYAAQQWPEHWKLQLSEPNQTAVNELIRRLLDTAADKCSNYINYVNICRPDAFVSETPSYMYAAQSTRAKSLDSVPQPLYYSAQLGHLELCQWLLDERSCDVNAVRGTFGQAIQTAARFGHRDVVALLLERGAKLDRHCGIYGYPLQAAAFGGYIEILSLLLDAGADINVVGGRYGTALIAACWQQHLGAVRALLDRGADMNVQCVSIGKALNVAAGTGNTALVRLLLSRGADINDTCGGYGTMLYAAAEKLHFETVKVSFFSLLSSPFPSVQGQHTLTSSRPFVRQAPI